MRTIRFTADAAKALRRHGNMADRLRRAIEGYAANPAAQANNVKALTGVGAKRLRVGDFRIIFRETEAEVLVLKIGPRGGVHG